MRGREGRGGVVSGVCGGQRLRKRHKEVAEGEKKKGCKEPLVNSIQYLGLGQHLAKEALGHAMIQQIEEKEGKKETRIGRAEHKDDACQ